MRFFRQKYLTSMHMYHDLMLDMMLFTCSFIAVKSDVGVMTSPRYYIGFSPAVCLVMQVSDFCGLMSHNALTQVVFLYFGLSVCRKNYTVSVPAYCLHPCDRLPSSLHIEFVHNGESFFTGYMYPILPPVLSQRMWFSVGSNVIAPFLRSMKKYQSVPMRSFVFVFGSIGNTVGAFLNVVTW